MNDFIKQDNMHFVLCSKQGNKIEGVVLNKPSVVHLYPNIGEVPLPPPGDNPGVPCVSNGLENEVRDDVNLNSFKCALSLP